MGIFGKLAFWKKKDDLGLDDLGKEFGLDSMQPIGPEPGLPQRRNRTGIEQDMNLGMPEDIGFGGIRERGTYSRGYSPLEPPGQPLPMHQPFGATIQPPSPTERDYKDDKFELVSAKLDSVRYTLESINQRLANLERVAYGEYEPKKRW